MIQKRFQRSARGNFGCLEVEIKKISFRANREVFLIQERFQRSQRQNFGCLEVQSTNSQIWEFSHGV